MTLAANTMQSGESAPKSDYVLDAPYTWSYFEYQNPLKMAFIANVNGFAAPSLDDDFAYCDLGCGNGVSVNLLAPMFPKGSFHGVDFNAEHIENANQLAQAGKLDNATFVDASFSDYASDDPPKFDFIALHGIYSWVSEEVRVQIRDLIDRTLNPGGLVYVCYNTLPGWSELIPLWRMMQSYTKAETGNSVDRAQKALRTISVMRDHGARYFRDNPSASNYLDRLIARDPNYVAHEFCNQIFEPMYFEDVARGLKDLGLSFAGTMKTHRNDVRNILPSDLLSFVDSASDPIEAEARRSLMRNEFFRRDLYVRDGLKLTDQERSRAISAYRFGSKHAIDRSKRSLSLGRRTINTTSEENACVLDHVANSGDALRNLIKTNWAREAEIIAATIDLVGTGEIQPTTGNVRHMAVDPGPAYRVAHAINRACLENILDGEGRCYLMAPNLGCAVRVNFIEGRLLRALTSISIAEAMEKIALEIRTGADAVLKSHGYSPDSAGAKRLERKAGDFIMQKFPELVALGVLEPVD